MGFIGVVVTLIGSFAVSVAVHEVGHLLAGLTAGHRLVVFRLFIWTVFRAENRWEVKAGFTGWPIGGQCLMVPRDSAGELRFRLFDLGGGIANAFVGLFALLVGLMFDLSRPWANGMVLLASVSFLFVLSQAIPISMEIPNDGWILLDTAKDPNGPTDRRAMLQITAALAAGYRLRDIDENLFQSNTSVPQNQFGWARMIYLADRLNDAGQRVEASRVFQSIDITALAEVYAAYVQGELLYNWLAHQAGHEPAQARGRALTRYLRTSAVSALRVRAAEAAFMHSSPAKALQYVARAERGLPTLGLSGAIIVERDELATLKAQIAGMEHGRFEERPDT